MTAATPASAISPATAPSPTATSEQRLARVEVDLDALVANWRLMVREAGPAEVAAVVKADGYGLGAEACSLALARAGARTFFVATAGEGFALRAALGAGPAIFILGGWAPGYDAAAVAKAGLTPILNATHQAASWRAAGWPGPAGLFLETGLNRLGVQAEEVAAVRDALAGESPKLVMSHLACASDPDHPMNGRQRTRFLEAAAAFPGVPRSLSASAGALLGPEYRFDLVRAGIALYGGAPLDRGGPAFAPVARLTAPVLQLRTIETGESVGYGAAWTASRTSRIATVGLGYADGVLRARESRGYGVVCGRACPLVGRISMDFVTLDVTEADGVAVGEPVELLGPSAALADAAEASRTIDYELLTSLARLPRRVKGGGL